MYKLINQTTIRRVSDGAHIPTDPANTDYVSYLAWLDAGNTPEPAEAPIVPKPMSVTMRQARLALLQAGYLVLVQSAINAIQDETAKQAAQIEWDYAATVDRDSSFTQGMSVALGLTEQDMDNLFTLAASL